ALDCIVAIDERGTLIEFNPAAERTFGYSRDQALGQRMADLIIPARLRDEGGLAPLLADGQSALIGTRQELVAMRADGTEFPVELAVTRVDLPGPPMFTGYVRDITARKQREAERRRTTDAL